MVQDIVPENEYDPCPDSRCGLIPRDFGSVEYCERLGMGEVCTCLPPRSSLDSAQRVLRKVQRPRYEQSGGPREQQPHLLPDELSGALCWHVGHHRVQPVLWIDVKHVVSPLCYA